MQPEQPDPQTPASGFAPPAGATPQPGYPPPPPPPPPPPHAPVYPQYPPPPVYSPYAVQQPVIVAKTNGLAIASLVLGIVWGYWVGSVLAVIFGHIALSQISKSHGTQQGRGMAIAGLVLGWIGVAVLIVVLIVAATNSGGSGSGTTY